MVIFSGARTVTSGGAPIGFNAPFSEPDWRFPRIKCGRPHALEKHYDLQSYLKSHFSHRIV
jgi:hypothetical protein